MKINWDDEILDCMKKNHPAEPARWPAAVLHQGQQKDDGDTKGVPCDINMIFAF